MLQAIQKLIYELVCEVLVWLAVIADFHQRYQDLHGTLDDLEARFVDARAYLFRRGEVMEFN